MLPVPKHSHYKLAVAVSNIWSTLLLSTYGTRGPIMTV